MALVKSKKLFHLYLCLLRRTVFMDKAVRPTWVVRPDPVLTPEERSLDPIVKRIHPSGTGLMAGQQSVSLLDDRFGQRSLLFHMSEHHLQRILLISQKPLQRVIADWDDRMSPAYP